MINSLQKIVVRTLTNPTITALVSLVFFSSSTHAHEYWLDPVVANVTVGTSVILDARNGEEFAGSGIPFLPDNYKKITIADQNTAKEYIGRIGDYPAIHSVLDSAGIHSVTLTTNTTTLIYESWEKFENFLRYHDLLATVQQHAEDSYPRENIKEGYRRYTRAFVQATDGNNSESAAPTPVDVKAHTAFAARGDEFEMILLNNPLSETNEVTIQLLKDQKPLAGRQTEMFWKGSFLLRFTELTNDDGIASFTLPGNGEYLLNAVHLSKARDPRFDWESLWASITFEVER